MKGKIKFGVIGFGIFGEKRLIPGFAKSSNSELIAISKRNMLDAEKKAKKYGIPFAYDNIDIMLSNNEVEAVFIASPNKFHVKHVRLAAERGKHILLEKPMGLNSKECEDIIRCCEKNHVQLMVAQCWRYNDTILKIKNMIETGKIGRLISLDCKFFFNGNYSKRTWLWDKEIAGGGPVMDLGVHCLDVLRFISGKKVVSSKSILEYPKVRKPNDVELKASILLQMEEGILGTISCGFEGSFLSAIEVIGEDAILRADMFNQIESEIELRCFSNRKLTIEKIQNENCYTKEIDDFARSILSKEDSPIPGIEGLINQQILDTILNEN